MADIKVRGFVKRGEVRDGSKGKFATYDLSEGVKQKDGTYKNTYYRVTDFDSESPPADGARVEVSGWFKYDIAERDGKTYHNLNIVSQAPVVLLAEPSPKPGAAAEAPKDEFDF